MSVHAKVIWLVSNLTHVGGGERLLLEGAHHFETQGIDTHIVTWNFHERALFDGKYSVPNLHVLASRSPDRGKILQRAWDRVRSIGKIRRLVRTLSPTFVICQSEYDAILAYVATLGTGVPFTVLIFGQTFQFPFDLAKYSLIFRRHLARIVRSMPGYADTVPLRMPRVPLYARLINELICLIRYFAIRAARARFVFSKQVQWETTLLYGAASHIAKGAFPRAIQSFESDRTKTRERLGIKPDERVVLALHRLEPKKRTEMIIEAVAAMKDPSIRLLVGGRGSEMDRLQNLARDLRVNSQVTFLGYVAEADVWPLKQASDLFVSVDIADYDISPLEALALGTRAIWTTEVDMDEELTRHSGLFLTEPNAHALNQTIRHALESQEPSPRAPLMIYSWEAYFDRIYGLSAAPRTLPLANAVI